MSLCDILVGDARAVLRDLPAASVQCAVTSPPYFGLRNYGADGQIGLEETPEAFVAALVEVFREVRRVLRPDGTLWLNLGDSYANDGKWGGISGGKNAAACAGGEGFRVRRHTGAKAKDLLMIPAMVALALRADGWWLRKDIIWHKPNPMPESAEDRPTSAHEHLFLLARSEAYFYDAAAIAEPATGLEDADGFRGGAYCDGAAFENGGDGGRRKVAGNIRQPSEAELLRVRNARDVWTIATQPCGDQLCQACGRFYSGREVTRLPRRRGEDGGEGPRICRCGSHEGWLAHYATMPPALAERCIRAGTSEMGACSACGAPWHRVIAKQRLRDGKPLEGAWARPEQARRLGATVFGHRRDEVVSRTAGWEPTCSCGAGGATVPQRVLDPFGGAGTTALVARRLQRAVTLVELHPGYARLARERLTADAPLLEAAS